MYVIVIILILLSLVKIYYYKMARRIIIQGFKNKELEKTLISRGVPPQDVPSKNVRIVVEESLVKIEPDIPNIIARSISISKQYKILESFVDHPLRSSTTLCIGSFPSDLRAKYLAIYLMALATQQHQKGLHKPGRTLPLWHRVFGGLSDPLRDKPNSEIPSLLVLANVNINSSQAKIEKVRDLLEKYSEIPVIVVTGGEPPVNLFANKLYYPLKSAIYLGPDNRVRETSTR
jgi:hypothetical protein